MPKKRNIVGVAILWAVTVSVVLCACNQGASDADNASMVAEMEALRSKLESGDRFQREEPFNLRALEPLIGDQWVGNAVAYGPYREGQAPGVKGPDDAELLEDLRIIAKHWNMIRLYGADGDTRRIVRLIDEHELPIKVIQGLWLEPEEGDSTKVEGNIRQVLTGVELAHRYPDVVAAISVGNETQVFWSSHTMDPELLIRYLRAVRNNVTVPVTTADDYLYWNKPESKRIAQESDFVFTHIHPLWNGKTLDVAVEWIDQIYRQLQELHPEREIVIGETGWATDYNSEKTGPGEQGTLVKGAVGLDAQAAFLADLDTWIESNRVITFLFEAFDESWKGGGESSPPSEIEKHWGVFNEDRTPKASFIRFLEQKDGNSE